MHDSAVIVPTVRDFSVVRSYFESASVWGVPTDRLFFIIVTEDFADKGSIRHLLRDLGLDGEVYGQEERDQWFRERGASSFSDLIPHRSHAETSFGLLRMQVERTLSYGFFIDDDTLPIRRWNYFGDHWSNLEFSGELDEVDSETRWVNPLYRVGRSVRIRPRGFPYGEVTQTERTAKASIQSGDIILSQGLWANVPDLDAVRILSEGGLNGIPQTRIDPDEFDGTFTIAPRKYTTICSMNLSFRREIIPAFYQLPMDDNPWRVGRFDDIWSGIFLKRVADCLGKRILTGPPIVSHNKHPRDVFRDLAAELPALPINETLSSTVDSVDVSATDYSQAYEDLARGLELIESGPILRFIGRSMLRWVDLVRLLS